MSNLADIKAKLAALLAKTEAAGASEDEAMAAARMAERIMARHGITLEDVAASATARDAFEQRAAPKRSGQRADRTAPRPGKRPVHVGLLALC